MGQNFANAATALHPVMSIPEAVKRAMNREHDAFVVLYEHYQHAVWQRLFYFVGNKEDAYDLFQNVFLKVWTHLPSKPETMEFEPWLFTIAKNMAIDHVRHTTKIAFVPLPEQERDDAVDFLQSPTRFEEHLGNMECLKEALAQLSQQYRICILLQDQWGYSQSEIARSLGVSEKTVSANVSRGRKQLREVYIRLMNGPGFPEKGGQIL